MRKLLAKISLAGCLLSLFLIVNYAMAAPSPP
jgi:hypothetical protein